MKVNTVRTDALNNVDSSSAIRPFKAATAMHSGTKERVELTLHTSNNHTFSEQVAPVRPTISHEEAVRLAILKTG